MQRAHVLCAAAAWDAWWKGKTNYVGSGVSSCSVLG